MKEDAPEPVYDRMEQWYAEWLDGPGYLDERDEHGSQRAAFFAGVHAGAYECRRSRT